MCGIQQNKLKYFLSLVVLTAPPLAFGQTDVVEVSQFNINMFTPLLIGTLIALSVSMVLLRLGMASGMNVVISKLRSFANSDDSKDSESKEESGKKKHLYDTAENLGDNLKTAVHAVGLGSILVVSLSLFTGVFIAAGMVGVSTLFYGLVLALSIWSIYTLTAGYLQSKVVNETLQPTRDFISGVSNGSITTLGSIFQKNDSKKVRDIVHDVITDMRSEFSGVYENSALHSQLNTLIKRMEQKDADSRELLTNLAEMLNHTEIKLLPLASGEERVSLHTDFSEMRFQSSSSKKVSSIGSRVFDEVANGSGDTKETMKSVAHIMTPGSEETTEKIMSKISDWLKQSESEDANMDSLKSEINSMVEDPEEAYQIIKQKLESFDRSSFIQSIAAATGISQPVLERNFGKIENYFRGSSSSQSSFGTMGRDLSQGGIPSSRVTSLKSSPHTEGMLNTPMGAEKKSGYMDKDFEKDFDRFMDSPSEVFSIIKDRWNEMSEDDVKDLLRSRTKLNEEQIDAYVMRYDRYKGKAKASITKARVKLKDAKIATNRLASDAASATTTAFWYRAATPIAGAAAAFGGAVVATL